jgi:hypothetical protein
MADPLFTSATPGAAVGIEVSHAPAMVAPAHVWLRATGHAGLADFEESGSVYDGAHHEYYHEWTIRGQPLPAWTKPENMIPAWNNPNRACGREVAFLLPVAGDYVIDLVVRDRHGNRALASTGSLTVVSPESHFPVRGRIYVDPDGDFTDVPAGARTATTMQDLADQMEATRGGAPWVLLRGGKTHDMTTRMGGLIVMDAGRRLAMLSSFGTGRATVVPSTVADRDQQLSTFEVWERPVTGFLTFTGIGFRGAYDAATERGSAGNVLACIGFAANSRLRDCFVTVSDITCSGMVKMLELGASSTGSANNRMMIADCDVTNWRNYGIFGGDMSYRYAFAGNRIVQHVDALHGGDKEDGLVNNHGPVRIPASASVYFSQNDLFSRTGWSRVGDGSLADQPCLRLLVSSHHAGQTATVERNVMEGGYNTVNVNMAEPTYAGDAEHRYIQPANLLLENNLLVGTAKNLGTGMEIWRGGVTVRNNLFIQPDVLQPLRQGGALFALGPGNVDADPANATNPVVIHSNTYLNLMAAPQAGAQTWAFLSDPDRYFTDLAEENNVIHKPGLVSAETTYAPIDVATVLGGFVPRFKGVRYGYDLTRQALSAAVAEGAQVAVPYSEIRKVLQDGTVVEAGATNQAYWLALAGTDRRHAIFLRGQARRLFAEEGHFSLTFDAAAVTITNTSGFTWKEGAMMVLHLDRTSLIPAMDTTYASPATIPLPRPLVGSPAIGSATMGRVTPADALQADRAAPPSRGALEPDA